MIPSDAEATVIGLEIEKLVEAKFASTQKDGYVLFGSGSAKPTPVSQALGKLVGLYGVTDLRYRNLLSEHKASLFHLYDFWVNGNKAGVSPDDLRVIEAFFAGVPEAIRLNSDPTDVRAIREMIATSRLPISNPVTASLQNWATSLDESTDVKKKVKQAVLSDLRRVSTPITDQFSDLFTAIRRLVSTSYTPQTISFPFLTSDLLRYGTLDFVEGVIVPLRQPRGFLMFSFYPTGPEERTPETDFGEDNFTLSIGHSVTGNAADKNDYLLAGLTFRLNRYLSATYGLATATSGQQPWLWFGGITGDLTAFPFLNNLFTVKSGE